MLKISTLVFIVVFSNLISKIAAAQHNFVAGYILMNNGDSVSGFIDYKNWQRIPKKVLFRKADSELSMQYALNEVVGFGVNERHYRRAIIATEVSYDNIIDLGHDPALTLEADTAFLEMMVLGEKSLFVYVNRIGKEQFYIYQNGVYELLEHKRYWYTHELQELVVENKHYQDQLELYFEHCKSLKNKIKKTPYTRKPLLHLFEDYYSCAHKQVNFIIAPEKIIFKTSLLVGFTYSRAIFSGNYYAYMMDAKFSASTRPSFGINLDVILPKNLKRLSIYNQLVYASMNIKDTFLKAYQTQLSINSIRVANQLRYRPYVKNKWAIFAQAGITSSFNFMGKNETLAGIPYGKTKKALAEIRAYEAGYTFGLGLSIRRFGLQFSMERSNGISTYTALQSSMRRFALYFSYQFI